MVSPRSWITVFAGHLTKGGPSIDRAVTKIVEQARAAWPAIDFEAEEFLRHLAARLRDDQPIAAALEEIRPGDLLLAFACARGDRHAIELFEERFFKELHKILAPMRAEPHVVEEVAQTLRAKLFVGDGDSPVKIGEYAGRGELRAWFRVTATRHAISTLRKPRREIGDEGLVSLTPATAADPELNYLRERYRREFGEVFDEAVLGLKSQERNLLRYHYVDRLNIDEIGAIYRIHRVSAARRLTKTREILVSTVRNKLRERLQVNTVEFDSILRFIQSEIHLSLGQVLRRAEEGSSDDPDG